MGRAPKDNLPKELAEILAVIGANLTSARTEHQLTQIDLAKKSKVSVTTINEIESRRFRDIRISTLISLAKALDISFYNLLVSSDVSLERSDHAKLLKASEDIVRIVSKVKKSQK